MNSIMIDNWNRVVQPNDVVWHLGDFILARRGTDDEGALRSILSQLNGKINIVLGSHDRTVQKHRDLFNTAYDRNTIVEIKRSGQVIIMGHCPMLSWEGRAHLSVHLFGHVHSSPVKPFICQQMSYDVGVDNTAFKPILLEEAIEKAKSPIGKLTVMDKYDTVVEE